MADEREIFSTLEQSDGSGAALSKVNENDASAGVNAAAGLVAKDSGGNLVFLPITAGGKLAVDTGTAAVGVEIHEHATVLGVIGVATDVAVITLTASKSHNLAAAVGACTKPVFWEIVHVNDATTTVLTSFITGSGAYSFKLDGVNIGFDSGASGTQEIKLRGTQIRGKASDMHGTISGLEKA